MKKAVLAPMLAGFAVCAIFARVSPAHAEEILTAPELAADLANPALRFPNARVDGVVGLTAPFGLLGGEIAAHAIGFPVGGLLLEGRAGGAWAGGTGAASGEWLRTKAGLSLRSFDEHLKEMNGSTSSGVTSHGLYVPLEAFHLDIVKNHNAETFFNTGIGYRYTRSTEEHWYLIDFELDYTAHRAGGRSGTGFLGAVEGGGEKLFVRVEGGVFHAGAAADFASTFRACLALGWHFGNMTIGRKLSRS